MCITSWRGPLERPFEQRRQFVDTAHSLTHAGRAAAKAVAQLAASANIRNVSSLLIIVSSLLINDSILLSQ